MMQCPACNGFGYYHTVEWKRVTLSQSEQVTTRCICNFCERTGELPDNYFEPTEAQRRASASE